MKAWAEVESDPGFQGLPDVEQKKVRQAYIDRASQLPAFQGMAPDQQQKVRQRVIGAQPASPILPGIQKAAGAAVEAFKQPFDIARRKLGATVPGMAETPIPGLAPLAESIEKGQSFIANKATDFATRAGLPPEAAGAVGTAAALPTMIGRTIFPIPKTVGEGALAAATVAAGAAAPKIFPALNTDLANLARRRLGFPETAEIVSGAPAGARPIRQPQLEQPPVQPGVNVLPESEAAINLPREQATLPTPQRPKLALNLERPIQGEGFQMRPFQEPLRRVYDPRLGELDVPAAKPADIAAAKLGMAPEKPAPRLTKKMAVDLLPQDPFKLEANIQDPSKLQSLVDLAKSGKMTESQLKRFTDRLSVLSQRQGAGDHLKAALGDLGLRPTATAAAPASASTDIAATAPPAEPAAPRAEASPSPASTGQSEPPAPEIHSASPNLVSQASKATSIAEHPLHFQAMEKAAPVLQAAGIDPNDVAASVAQADKWNDRIHELLRMSISKEWKTMTPEQKAPFEAEANDLAPKVAATRDLRNVHLGGPGMLEVMAKNKGLPGNSQAMLEALAGKPLGEMTPEEFGQRFEGVDPSIHQRAADQTRTDYEAKLAAEEARDLKARGYESTPVMKMARKRGLSPEAAAEFGSLDALKQARIPVRDGGLTISELAENAWEAGHLPENDNNQALDALAHEIDTGTRKDFGGSDWSGQGGFVGGKPGAGDPPDVAGYKSRIHSYDPEPISPAKFGQKLITEIVNKDKALYDLRGLYPDSLNAGEDLANLLHTSLGANGIAENNLQLGTWLRNPDGSLTRTGEPLAPTLKAIGGRWQDMDAYLSSKRDWDLAQRNVEDYAAGEVKESIHGLDPEKARKISSYMENKHPDFQQLAGEVRDWTKRAILDPAVDLGIISSESAAKIEATGDYYTPFRRWSDEWNAYGGGAGGNPIKRMKGSEKDIFSPLQTLLDMNYTSARYFEKVRVGQSIFKMKDLNPELSAAIKEVPKAAGDTIAVPIEGKTRFLKVSPEVKIAFESLRPAESQATLSVLGLWAKFQRAGITLDPRFSAYSHNVRYQAEAYLYAKHGFIPGYDFLRGLAASLGKNEYYDEAMAAGMDRASMVAMDLYNKPRMIAELTGTREIPKNPALWVLEKMRELGDKSVQMGIYLRARESGADATSAAAQARAGALDFGIRGGSNLVQNINRLTPFFNLHLQGLARPIDVLSGKGSAQILGSRAQFMTKASSLIALTAGLWYLNKDNKEYQEKPDWQKILLWHVPVPTSKGVRLIPIPKPFIEGIFFMGGTEMLLQHVFKQDPQAVEHWAKTTLGTLVPSPVPPFIKTPFELAANYSFLTGRPIEPPSKSKLLPEDRFGDYNSELGKRAAKTSAGRALGVSPAKFDYAAQGLGGTLARRLLGATDMAMGKQQPARPDWDIMYSRPSIGSNSESVNRFYDTLTKLQQQHASANSSIGVHGLTLPESPYLKIMMDADMQIRRLREISRLVSKDKHASPEAIQAHVEKNNTAITEIAHNALKAVQSAPDSGATNHIVELIQKGKTPEAYDAYAAMAPEARAAFMKQLDVSEAGRAIKGRLFQEHNRRNPGGQ